VAEQQVGGAHRGDDLLGAAHDRARQPGGHGHGQEGGIELVTARQPEGDVRGAQAHVHAELVADEADRLERDRHRVGGRADRHGQRVDDDVLRGDAMVAGGRHDLAGDLQALLRRLGDAGLVVGQADDRGAVAGDEGQDLLEALVLARDRVDQRLALVDREAGLERLDDRRVDADRRVGRSGHRAQHVLEQLGLVDERDAGVDVEHVGAGRHLGDGVDRHGRQVAAAQLLGERLAPGGVDALPDDAEGLIVADDDGARA
jgi:hypothetical protein